jgi:hypothetical protein
VGIHGMTRDHYVGATLIAGMIATATAWFARIWMTTDVATAFGALQSPNELVTMIGRGAVADMPILSWGNPITIIGFLTVQTALVCIATLLLTRLIFGADD